MRRVLVTGSSGTIGTYLCQKLLAQGFEVTGVDWRENKWDPVIEAKTIRQDLRDLEGVLEKLPDGGTDLVIHLAANARVHNLVIDPTLARDNFLSVFNVLEYVRRRNMPRLMFASSREVYGNTGKVTHAEEDTRIWNCPSPYTASKMSGEALVHSYQKCYGLKAIIYRFSNVYGLYDESDRVVPLFIRQCLAGEPLKIFGRDKLLDFTYISDAVRGILLGIEHFEAGTGGMFNIAYGQGKSLVEVAEFMKRQLGTDNDIEIHDNRTGEVVKYIADISRAKHHFGYKPEVLVEDGIERAVAWYTHNLYGPKAEARKRFATPAAEARRT